MNALQLADSFHVKKLCSRLSSSEVRFFYGNRPFCFFEPPLERLGAIYNVRLRLNGKHMVDFLLVLIELFCYVLPVRRYERISTENRQFHSNGVSLTQNFKYKGSPPPTILLLRKLGLMIFRMVSKYEEIFFHFVTMHAFDRQTDTFLVSSPRWHSMQHGKKTAWSVHLRPDCS